MEISLRDSKILDLNAQLEQLSETIDDPLEGGSQRFSDLSIKESKVKKMTTTTVEEVVADPYGTDTDIEMDSDPQDDDKSSIREEVWDQEADENRNSLLNAFRKRRRVLWNIVKELRGQVKNRSDEHPLHQRTGNIICPVDQCESRTKKPDGYKQKGDFVVHCTAAHPLETYSIFKHENDNRKEAEEWNEIMEKPFITPGTRNHEKKLMPSVQKYLKQFELLLEQIEKIPWDLSNN